MARPKKEIDEARVAEMAAQGASNREIADILGCDDKTIANRFSALLRKKRAERRLGLREAQWRAALKGNPALLIWLGKQELDQRDGAATGSSIEEFEADAKPMLEGLIDRLAARARTEEAVPVAERS